MVGSLEKIEQDMAALQAATTAIATELHQAYAKYLTVLGQSVRQQLILASYHLCTQGYPEQFLRLSYSQRQQLQQMLRQLAAQLQEELLAQLHVPLVPPEPDDLETRSPDDATNDATVETALSATPDAPPQPLTPIHLAQWREDMEQAIVDELRTTSHAANRLLQQVGVLARSLPEPILEAATKAEMSDVGGGTPNLLNLLIEAGSAAAEKESAEDAKGPAMLHIIAIYLRLPEIEFGDPAVAAARSQIRSLLARLKTLGREYQKKQRERTIAEAQAAWRSSWVDD